ncbi:MAG: LysM peptidoglycan-binding domain-containing protein [Anaerolineales bacterium]|nr:LysM peptidoglycan-binding domain-containing protein [Chloroflexota bacterium]MBL6981608.1 LysM peptidoglycan-binding domain-containing protein [Anaerolineales bacterium]
MMKKNHMLLIAIVLLLAIVLSACERSASSAMPGTEGGESDFPLPESEVGTPSALEALEAITTQTAIVESGEEAAAPQGEENALPADEIKPTETPQPQPVEEPQVEAEPEAEPVEVEDYAVPNTYTLKSGEFPYCIARRFDIAPAALLSANGLSSSSMTYPGTVLTIPKNAGHYNLGSRALRAHPTTYVVRSGDTANSVACLFGDVDPRAIRAVNGIEGALPVGKTIQIP